MYNRKAINMNEQSVNTGVRHSRENTSLNEPWLSEAPGDFGDTDYGCVRISGSYTRQMSAARTTLENKIESLKYPARFLQHWN